MQSFMSELVACFDVDAVGMSTTDLMIDKLDGSAGSSDATVAGSCVGCSVAWPDA